MNENAQPHDLEGSLRSLANDMAQVNVDALGIVNLTLTQVQLTEKRILDRIEENSDAARERWGVHEKEHADLVGWLKALDRRTKETADRLADHLQNERDEDIRFDARFGPMKSAGRWFVREWRIILIIVALTLANLFGDAVFGGAIELLGR